ncbi:MAG: helix-turn-helix transcriptional regulator [Peptococcaceae bacterium]|nr:helix-turn-helix transcriptional regulator [Peptococcaceae bacterium]
MDTIKKRKQKPNQEVRNELFEQRITYSAMAKRLGMSITSFNARMQGEIPFTLPEACRMARVLGVPIVKLFCLESYEYVTEKKEAQAIGLILQLLGDLAKERDGQP